MATLDHCAFCFDCLIAGEHGKPSPTPALPSGKEKFPLFVTWKKKHGNEWRLRGCIGTFSAKELTAGLRDYALISAFQDPRFSAISPSEHSSLSCHVSLLLHFEVAKSYDDWIVGKHGITIDFTDTNEEGKRKTYSATYLPEVAEEQGWDVETTIEELISKSGYRGRPTAALKKSIKCTRYQSAKCSMTYEQFLQFKKNRTALKS